MSGPIVPPLEVTEVDGSPDGRPITKIVVSNGDLTVSGRTATIDTSGSTTTPGGSDTEVQYNNAGAFGGDAGFTVETAGGGDTTKVRIGALEIYNDNILVRATNADLSIKSDGTGEIILRSSSEAGGTFTDSIVNILSNSNTDDAQLKFRDSANVDNGSITLDGSGHMILNNNVAAKDIDLKVLTTGQVEIANQTTDTESVLSIMGNGTGDAKIDLQNASERVWVLMDENKKLKIKGGSGGNTFVFDASSATGGMTFPDGKELVSAEGTAILATGVTDGYVLTADGSDAAAWEAAGGGGASAIGDLSDATTVATDNLGLGSGAGDSLSATSNNTLVGIDAGTALVGGAGNTALGYKALESATGLKYCVAIGNKAGDTFNSAWDAVMIGNNAGGDSTSAGLIAIGTSALKNSASYGAVGIGQNAGQWTQGNYTIAIGDNALKGPSDETGDGVQNVGIGYNAGRLVSTGERNIFIGNYCCDLHTTGSGCVIIGDTLETTAVDTDQELRIAGNDGTTTVTWVLGDSAGSCYQGDNASTWSTTSDQILKREIEDATSGLDAINQVRVRTFRYIERATPITEVETVKSANPDDEGFERINIVGYEGENTYNLDPEPRRTGVIAQEIQEVFPEAVTENEKGHLTVNHDSINWALLKAVQELSAKVEALEAA